MSFSFFDTDNISTWDGEAFSLATIFVPGFGYESVNTSEVFEFFKDFLSSSLNGQSRVSDPRHIYDMEFWVSHSQKGLQKIF